MLDKIEYIDYLEYVKNIPDNYVNLAILDPPYNIGVDKWDIVEDYYNWLIKVLTETERVSVDNASLYLWGTVKNNDFLRIKLWLDSNFKLMYKNWIVWIHEVKQHRQLVDRYLHKHEDLLFYAGENNTFNVVRDNPPEFQLKMHKNKYDENFFIEHDKLPPSQQKIFKNGLQLGSPAKSWWKGPSNKSNAKKIKGFMGYKSKWVCERIISVSSNENDVVLIPFAGSGTECVSAMKLNRRFISCEKDKEMYKVAINRITQDRLKI